MNKRESAVFLTGLNDTFTYGTGLSIESADSNDDCTLPLAAQCENSNGSGVEGILRGIRHTRDVNSAEVDLIGYQSLPTAVKLSSIIDRVLREAPFVVGGSKALWHAFLISRPFKELATDGFWFVVAHEVLGKSVNAAQSHRFTRMAHVYCHMFTNAPVSFKDIWGTCFFEAWAFTLLLLLQECFPKSKPLFDKPSFRLRLLDLCAEWTLGMRPSFPLSGHWVLKFDKRPPTELELLKRRTFGAGLSGSVSTPDLSSNDVEGSRRSICSSITPRQHYQQQQQHQQHHPLLPCETKRSRRIKTRDSTARRREKVPEHRLNFVPSRSVVEFGNSPLVHQHLSLLNGVENVSVAPIRLHLTGEASRTLQPFHEIGLQLANDRSMRSNAWRAGQALRAKDNRPATADVLNRIDERRVELLRQHAASRKETRQDISRLRATAAEDRSSIQAEATHLLSKGDVHEFSNFLVKDASRCRRGQRRNGSGRRRKRTPVASSSSSSSSSTGGGGDARQLNRRCS